MDDRHRHYVRNGEAVTYFDVNTERIEIAQVTGRPNGTVPGYTLSNGAVIASDDIMTDEEIDASLSSW